MLTRRSESRAVLLPLEARRCVAIASFALLLALFKGAGGVENEDAIRAGFSRAVEELLQLTHCADSITWADYWSAQKPGSSGSFSDFYTKYSCCQRLGSSDEGWAGAKDCVCRPIVKYKTVHACGLKAACSAAARDIKDATARIVDFTNKPVTQACMTALQDAVCSYHFWGCSGDYPEVVYNNVCLDVCTAVETSCSVFGFDVSLSNFTKGMYYHRGCLGFNGTFAQDCTRPSPAVEPLLHTAAPALSLLLMLLAL